MMSKNVKRGMRYVIIAIAIAFTVSNVAPSAEAAKKVTVKKVSITKPGTKSISLAKGKKYSLKVSVTTKPSKKAYKKVRYTSSKAKIVSVSKKGVLSAKKLGKATITVTSITNKKKKAKIQVIVVAPAKMVTLSSAKQTLDIGKYVELQATITPSKGTYKKVTWKSSDASVANVTTSGVVTALKQGTAKVTATTMDGTKKSASCIVTVNAPRVTPIPITTVSINSIEVLNRHMVKVVLSGEKTLTEANFIISTKEYTAFNKSYTPMKIVRQDPVTYIVTLEDELYTGLFVKATIASLDGTKEKETQFLKAITAEETFVIGMVGSSLDQSIYFDNTVGDCKFSLSGALPEGLGMEENTRSIEFTGRPNKVVDNYQVTLSATDELGRTGTVKITFSIGDDTHIAAMDRLITSGVKDYLSFYIYPEGGSGNYTFTVEGLLQAGIVTSNILDSLQPTPPYNPEVTDIPIDTNKFGVWGSSVEVGKREVKIKITDKMNPNITKTITITVDMKQTYEISGNLTDVVGNRMTEEYIIFEDINGEDYYSVKTGTNGEYKVDVLPGTYEIYKNVVGTYIYMDTVTVSTANVTNANVKIRGAYKVKLDITQPIEANVTTWNTNVYVVSSLTDTNIKKAENLLYNNYVYLNPGSYYIYVVNSGYDKDGYLIAKYTEHAAFTVSNSDLSITMNSLLKDNSTFPVYFDVSQPYNATEIGTVQVQLTNSSYQLPGIIITNGKPLNMGTYYLYATYTTSSGVYMQKKIITVNDRGITAKFTANSWTYTANPVR